VSTNRHELLAQWPNYAAFVVSFLTIGIIWTNHHPMVRRLRRLTLAICAGGRGLLCEPRGKCL